MFNYIKAWLLPAMTNCSDLKKSPLFLYWSGFFARKLVNPLYTFMKKAFLGVSFGCSNNVASSALAIWSIYLTALPSCDLTDSTNFLKRRCNQLFCDIPICIDSSNGMESNFFIK
jgi:hypothetical protein